MRIGDFVDQLLVKDDHGFSGVGSRDLAESQVRRRVCERGPEIGSLFRGREWGCGWLQSRLCVETSFPPWLVSRRFIVNPRRSKAMGMMQLFCISHTTIQRSPFGNTTNAFAAHIGYTLATPSPRQRRPLFRCGRRLVGVGLCAAVFTSGCRQSVHPPNYRRRRKVPSGAMLARKRLCWRYYGVARDGFYCAVSLAASPWDGDVVCGGLVAHFRVIAFSARLIGISPSPRVGWSVVQLRAVAKR